MRRSKTSLVVSQKGIADKLISGITVEDVFSVGSTHIEAIWDTGSTRSVITKATADALGLFPVGRRTVRGVHGVRTVNVYLVSIRLDDTDIVVTDQVTECDELSSDGSIGALIGMNIISTGDFAISNYRGRTNFPFRSPSVGSADYTKTVKKK